jgi:hypothetical protein
VDAGDRVIPECTTTQLYLVRTILPEYLDAYTEISDPISPVTPDEFAEHTDEVDELIADMHEMQLQWRREGEGEMPDCLLAADISSTLGRLFDETLISMLLLDAVYMSFADWHADPILERLLRLLDSEMAGSSVEARNPFPEKNGPGFNMRGHLAHVRL